MIMEDANWRRLSARWLIGTKRRENGEQKGGGVLMWSSTFPFPASLIDVSSSVVEDSEHRNDSIR